MNEKGSLLFRNSEAFRKRQHFADEFSNRLSVEPQREVVNSSFSVDVKLKQEGYRNPEERF